MNVSMYFSQTYSEARAKFLASTYLYDVETESHMIQDVVGALAEPLSMDVIRIGDVGATRILFILSGVHGVEGYCGSGIQIAGMQLGLYKRLPPDLAVVFVHAVNPFGFSYDRRVNEDNIDLNRNFVDFSSPLPGNERYDALHSAILPGDWLGDAYQSAEQVIGDFIKQNGVDAYQAVFTQGQYQQKDGVYYGGRKESWSRKVLTDVLVRQAWHAEKVFVLDVHTGLGPCGYGEPVFWGDESQYLHYGRLFNGEVTSTHNGTSSSSAVVGALGGAVQQILPHTSASYMALEFGTKSILDVLDALRADNWLHARDQMASDRAKQIKKSIRDAFYCDDDFWKESVTERGLEVIKVLLDDL